MSVNVPTEEHHDNLQERLANALGLPPGGEVRHLGLDRRYRLGVGGQRFLLDLSLAVHVIDVPVSYRLPNTRPWFLGIVNLRGALVPLYDLAAFLELPAPPEGERMMLVVGDGDEGAATIIDAPPTHVSVSDELRADELPSLDPLIERHARVAYRLADGIWVELDWDALFQELKGLAVR